MGLKVTMSQEEILPNAILDARDMDCPMPLLKTKLELNGMESGSVLKVIATDPASQRDFRAFADLAGHGLSEEQDADQFVFYLTKA